MTITVEVDTGTIEVEYSDDAPLIVALGSGLPGAFLPLTGGDLSEQLRLSAGTVGAPALSRTGDADTGIYFPAAGGIGFAVNGVAAATLNSSGWLGIGTPTPVCPLHVIGLMLNQNLSPGLLYSAGDLSMGLNFNFGTDGTAAYIGTGSNHPVRLLANNAEVIRLTTSRDVGVDTAAPTAKLHVNGPIRVGSFTVGTLPAAGTVGAGTLAWVTDANATTRQAVVAGGGANALFVYSDGTNWRIV